MTMKAMVTSAVAGMAVLAMAFGAEAQVVELTAAFSTGNPATVPGIGGTSTYTGAESYDVRCGKKTCTDYEGAFLSGTNALSIQLSSAPDSPAFGPMPFAFGVGEDPASSDLPDACKPGVGFSLPLSADDVDFRFYVGKASKRGEVNVPFTTGDWGDSIDGDLTRPYYVKGVVNFWASPTVYLSLYYNHTHDGTFAWNGTTLTLDRLASGWRLSSSGGPVLMECRVTYKSTIKVYTAGTYMMPFTVTATPLP